MYNVSLELLKLYSSRDQLSAQDISAITNKDARIIYENIQCLAALHLRDALHWRKRKKSARIITLMKSGRGLL